MPTVILVVLAVVLLLGVVVAVAARAWSERAALRWIAALDPDGLYDEARTADPDVGVVTWQQVAGMLPPGIVDEVQRAVDGRRPVLRPDLPEATRGGYPHVTVYPVDGEPYDATGL